MRNDSLPIALVTYIFAVLLGTAAHAQGGKETGTELAAAVEGVMAVTRAYDISTEVDNRIDRIHFVEGQPVKKGDLFLVRSALIST